MPTGFNSFVTYGSCVYRLPEFDEFLERGILMKANHHKKGWPLWKKRLTPLAIGVSMVCGGLFPAAAQALLVDGPGLVMIIDGTDSGDNVGTFNIDATVQIREYDFGFVDENGFTPIALQPAGPASVFGSYSFEGGTLVNFALRSNSSGLIYSIADPVDYADQLYQTPIDPSHSSNPPVSFTYYNSLRLEWDLDLNGVGDAGYTLTTANDPFDGLAPVPLPASFLLFGSGLAGLGAAWKRFLRKG
jgi:hypothetical protein